MTTGILQAPVARVSLRARILLAFGVLVLLLALVLALALVNALRLREIARSAVEVDARQSRLASDVALATLECRRFEKDMLINMGDPAEQARYREQWAASHAQLRAAIAAFDAAAASEADRRQAAVWSEQSVAYGRDIAALLQAIDRGEIRSVEQANAAFTPFKATIRTLTDSALDVVGTKAEAALRSEQTLDDRIAALGLQLAVVGAILIGVAVGWGVVFARAIVRPIVDLRAAAMRMAGGDYGARVVARSADEIGDLAASFNQMALTVQARTSQLGAEAARAEAARAEAEARSAQIAEQLATIEAQRETIRAMDVPILPLSDQAIVMPLVGALDSGRLREARERALHGLSRASVRHLILDITGVPVVDADVAHGLLQVVDAARLLGAEVVLVGIRPEIAQTFVSLSIRLDHVVTRTTLQGGIAYATSR